jgi:hypothetical protein
MAKHKEPTDAEIAAEAAAIYPDTNAGAPTEDEIAVEAHAIYVSRGGEHGHDMDDWLEAERRVQSRRQSAGKTDTWQERAADRRAQGADDLKG